MVNKNILLIMFIVLTSTVYAQTLQEHYLPAEADLSVQFAIHSTNQMCQSWLTSSSYPLSHSQWGLKWQNGVSFAGTLSIRLYNSSGSGNFDTMLKEYLYQDTVNFTLDNTLKYYNLTMNDVTLDSGVEYGLCLRSNTALPNGIHIYGNASNPFAGGGVMKASSYSTSPPTDNAYYASRDLAFAIYSEDVGGGNETDAPVFSNYNQFPSNATLYNVAEGVWINVTITDASTIIDVNLTHSNNGNVYINGTQYDINIDHKPIFNASDIYQFYLEETDFLPGTYNYDHEGMEDAPHSSFLLKGLNKYLSMEFYNVSNTSELNFFEIMDENATSNPELAQYWYCNSGYDFATNVNSHSSCVLFASVLNTAGFNHSHGQSKHRIIPMGADTTTGTINGVTITPVSYILKRGTQFGDNVYYIDNRTREGAFYTTVNNGGSWLEWTDGTIDAHIHQVPVTTALHYNYSACDEFYNCDISTNQYDLIEIGNINPNAVEIYNPTADSTHTESITINHSVSGSASGSTILNYTYQFKEDFESTYTYLGFNTPGTETYVWDITALDDGTYNLQVVVLDSVGLTSTTLQTFIIDNPPTTAEAITTLDENLQEVFGNMNSTYNMFAILFFNVVLTGFAIWLINKNQIIPSVATLVLSYSTDIYLLGYWYNRIVTENIILGTGFLQNFNTVFLVLFSLIIIWKPVMLFSLKKVRI